MDGSKIKRQRSRKTRVLRVRKKLRGTQEKPRLSVFKTNQHIYAQIIDDVNGVTLAGVGSLSKKNQSTEYNKKSKEAAFHIGKQIAEMAKEKNIDTVVFDRGRYKYHGVIARLADGAREAGLRF